MVMEYFDPAKLFSLYIGRPLSSELIIKPNEDLPDKEKFNKLLLDFEKAFQDAKIAWENEGADIENFISCRENFKKGRRIKTNPDHYLEVLANYMKTGSVLIYDEFSQDLKVFIRRNIKGCIMEKKFPGLNFNFMSALHSCYEKIFDFVKKYTITLKHELFAFIDTQWDRQKRKAKEI